MDVLHAMDSQMVSLEKARPSWKPHLRATTGGASKWAPRGTVICYIAIESGPFIGDLPFKMVMFTAMSKMAMLLRAILCLYTKD